MSASITIHPLRAIDRPQVPDRARDLKCHPGEAAPEALAAAAVAALVEAVVLAAAAAEAVAALAESAEHYNKT